MRSRTTILALLVSVIASAQTPPVTVKVFGVVKEGVLYRGAQPAKAGLEELAKLGIKTVLNLRDDATVDKEKTVVESLGMEFLSVRLNGLKAPTAEQTDRIQALLDSAAKPIFIHCEHGRDRTGTQVAVWRMLHEHWSNEKALQEAKTYKINPVQLGMKHYILHYKVNMERSGL